MADGTSIALPDLKRAFAEALAEWSQNSKPAPAAAQPDAAVNQEAGVVQASQVDVLRGPIDTLDNFRIPVVNVSLPFGSAIVGGFTGLFVGGVVDAVVSPTDSAGKANLWNISANVLAAGGVVKVGPGIIGSSASKFAAGTLGLKLAMRFLPIQEWVSKMVDAIATPLSGVVPEGMKQVYSAAQEAEQVAHQAFNPQPSTGGPWA